MFDELIKSQQKRKSDAAQNDQRADGDLQWVIEAQRGGVKTLRVYGETCVAKSGDGVKNGILQLVQPVTFHSVINQGSACGLQENCKQQDLEQELIQTTQVFTGEKVFKQELIFEGD